MNKRFTVQTVDNIGGGYGGHLHPSIRLSRGNMWCYNTVMQFEQFMIKRQWFRRCHVQTGSGDQVIP